MPEHARPARLGIACLLLGCAHAVPIAAHPTPDVLLAEGREVPVDLGAIGSLAMAATPDLVALALGPSDDASPGESGHFVALALDGTVITRADVRATLPPFAVRESESAIRLVWPGASSDALPTLGVVRGTTRVVHESASTYFTAPYAALSMTVPGADAIRFVVLHRDAVSCLVGGVSTSASIAGSDPQRSFAAPGTFRTDLALAPLGDGLLATYAPGEGTPSAWRLLDAELVPRGEPRAEAAAGCTVAASLGARAVVACVDEGFVVDEGGAIVDRLRYPRPGSALAATAVGDEVAVLVRVEDGLDLVAAPSGRRLDAIATRVRSNLLDPAPHAALASPDGARLFAAWLEADETGRDARLRVRAYAPLTARR